MKITGQNKFEEKSEEIKLTRLEMAFMASENVGFPHNTISLSQLESEGGQEEGGKEEEEENSRSSLRSRGRTVSATDSTDDEEDRDNHGR